MSKLGKCLKNSPGNPGEKKGNSSLRYKLGKPNNFWLSRYHNTEKLPHQSQSFNDEDVHFLLDREKGCFEQRVREAIYVKREQSSLKQGEGLRVHLS